jgi:hypothetical protein
MRYSRPVEMILESAPARQHGPHGLLSNFPRVGFLIAIAAPSAARFRHLAPHGQIYFCLSGNFFDGCIIEPRQPAAMAANALALAQPSADLDDVGKARGRLTAPFGE